jgi:hypothetical protein
MYLPVTAQELGPASLKDKTLTISDEGFGFLS